MYRFIGVMKVIKDEVPYRLLLTYKDFTDKKDAMKRLKTYTKISIPKTTFAIIDKPISIDEFFEKKLELVDKNLCAHESLKKLERILSLKVVEKKKYRDVNLLFSDRETIFDLFDPKEEDFEEMGKVALSRGFKEGATLGKPRLKIDLNLDK